MCKESENDPYGLDIICRKGVSKFALSSITEIWIICFVVYKKSANDYRKNYASLSPFESDFESVGYGSKNFAFVGLESKKHGFTFF